MTAEELHESRHQLRRQRGKFVFRRNWTCRLIRPGEKDEVLEFHTLQLRKERHDKE